MPLDIQAVGFDVVENKFYYTPNFLNALQKKRIGANNYQVLIKHCRIKKITIEDYMKQKADNLGFSYHYDAQPKMVK